jgi:transcriptional regulator with GAF, ATPase, and Fis domain
MPISESDFFREATLRLCGNLDIQQAMRDCCDYMKGYIPVSRMHLQIYNANLNTLLLISSAVLEGEGGHKVVHIPQECKPMWLQHWDGYTIINNLETEPWLLNHVKSVGRNIDVSLILMRVRTVDSFASVAIAAEGRDVYTEEHARMLLLLQKPFTIAVANALQHLEVLRLRDLLAEEQTLLRRKLNKLSDDIIGRQLGLRDVIQMVMQVAPLESPVLLLGETGTGKDLMANLIHDTSPRHQGPFVSVNCGAIPESLFDSELFGHEKGAFTGAINQRIGRFERANKGTIFLDEIGEISLQGQVRLLRILQYKEIERVGGTRPISIDTRIVAATNRNLAEMVNSGTFRRDLWYRLNVFPITIPPLRERKADIPELLHYFLDRKRKELKLDITPKFRPRAIDRLLAYDWPGNVRELQNIIERALIRNEDGLLPLEELIDLRGVESDGSIGESDVESRGPTLDNLARNHILRTLSLTAGKINGPGGAAELLGIHPNTLRKRMIKLGIPYKRHS